MLIENELNYFNKPLIIIDKQDHTLTSKQIDANQIDTDHIEQYYDEIDDDEYDEDD